MANGPDDDAWEQISRRQRFSSNIDVVYERDPWEGKHLVLEPSVNTWTNVWDSYLAPVPPPDVPDLSDREHYEEVDVYERNVLLAYGAVPEITCCAFKKALKPLEDRLDKLQAQMEEISRVLTLRSAPVVDDVQTASTNDIAQDRGKENMYSWAPDQVGMINQSAAGLIDAQNSTIGILMRAFENKVGNFWNKFMEFVPTAGNRESDFHEEQFKEVAGQMDTAFTNSLQNESSHEYMCEPRSLCCLSCWAVLPFSVHCSMPHLCRFCSQTSALASKAKHRQDSMLTNGNLDQILCDTDNGDEQDKRFVVSTCTDSDLAISRRRVAQELLEEGIDTHFKKLRGDLHAVRKNMALDAASQGYTKIEIFDSLVEHCWPHTVQTVALSLHGNISKHVPNWEVTVAHVEEMMKPRLFDAVSFWIHDLPNDSTPVNHIGKLRGVTRRGMVQSKAKRHK